VFAIAIMDGVGPALADRPHFILLSIAAAFALNIVLQILGTLCFSWLPRRQALTIGFLSGNRNLALLLAALADTAEFDVLVFFAQIKGVARGDARRRAAQWLDRMGLSDRAHKPVDELSKGMQQKVQFIATLIHEPELLILDEPFSGLDPVNANVLMDVILEFHRKGHTIVFSTHMMEQVEKLCEHICLINKGRVVLSGTLSSVKKQYGHNGVTVRFNGDGSFLGTLPEVASFQDHGNEWFLRLRDGAAPARILDAARGRLEILRFEVAEPSVHDIFIERVSES